MGDSIISRAHIFGSDDPAETHNGQPGHGAVLQPASVTLTKPAANEQDDSLAQRLVRVPCDRHHVRVKAWRQVDGNAHTCIIAQAAPDNRL
jgi:hypothetical protein